MVNAPVALLAELRLLLPVLLDEPVAEVVQSQRRPGVGDYAAAGLVLAFPLVEPAADVFRRRRAAEPGFWATLEGVEVVAPLVLAASSVEVAAVVVAAAFVVATEAAAVVVGGVILAAAAAVVVAGVGGAGLPGTPPGGPGAGQAGGVEELRLLDVSGSVGFEDVVHEVGDN